MKPNKLEKRKWPKEYPHQHLLQAINPLLGSITKKSPLHSLIVFRQSELHSAPPPQLDKVLTT